VQNNYIYVIHVYTQVLGSQRYQICNINQLPNT